MSHQRYTPRPVYYRWHARVFVNDAGEHVEPSIPPGSVVHIVEENGTVRGQRHVRVAGIGCGGGIFFRFLEPVLMPESEPVKEIADAHLL